MTVSEPRARVARAARVFAAAALFILFAGLQAPAKAINITVDGVIYDLTVSQSTFNANRATLESQPWWNLGDGGARADDFINAYRGVGTNTSTDFGFANINFGYAETSVIISRQLANNNTTGTTGISASSNSVPWAQVTFVGAVPVPEIDGAALGQVLVILGGLYLWLRGRRARRGAGV
jgi:hypothetical protein